MIDVNTQEETRATVSPDLTSDAPASPPPPPATSLLRRVAAAIETFTLGAFGPGDNAERFLPLAVRFEEWLGRPATGGEMAAYADAMAESNLSAGNRTEILEGDWIVVPFVEGHARISADSVVAPLLRAESERQGGLIQLAEALSRRELDASRTGFVDLTGEAARDPLAGLEVSLTGEEESPQLALRIARADRPKPHYHLELVADGRVLDGDNATDIPEALDAAFRLGRVHSQGERTPLSTVRRRVDFAPGTAIASETTIQPDADLAAIRALGPGETWTKVIADGHREAGDRYSSLRTCVERPFDRPGLRVFLERYGINAERRYDTWSRVTPLTEGDECLMVGVGFDDDVELADALAVHRAYAAHAIAIMRDEARLAMPAEKADDPAVAAILALGVGETWTEERWGPYYLPGSVIDGERYPTASYRIVAGRRSAEEGRSPFLLRTETSWCGDPWKKDDLGFGRGGDEAFEMSADESSLDTCLAAFRALLDHEGRERETDEDAIAEREVMGITDEHLRAGTLSEKTLALRATAVKEAA